MEGELFEIEEVLTTRDILERLGRLDAVTTNEVSCDDLEDLSISGPSCLSVESVESVDHELYSLSVGDDDDEQFEELDRPPARVFHKSAYRGAASAPHRPPPPWAIGFSKQFNRDTAELDRKLLGRVLVALGELSATSVPLRARGDTFKPLEGNLKGCWRYRIGDHRLVVKPTLESARIDALTLAARGSVYD